MSALAHSRRSGGFTLIEALIALLLLALGTVSLMTLQFRLRLAADEVRQHDHALRLARNELARWRDRPEGAAPQLVWEGPDTLFRIEGRAASWAEVIGGTGSAGPPSEEAMTVALPLRPVRLIVEWTNRAGESRSLALDSLLPTGDPGLPGLLLIGPKTVSTSAWAGVPDVDRPHRAAPRTRLRAMQDARFANATSPQAPETRDDRWMAEAVRLAHGAVGLSDPNPRVGCVITDAQDRVLGRGHTQAAGRAHAEVMALRDAQARG